LVGSATSVASTPPARRTGGRSGGTELAPWPHSLTPLIGATAFFLGHTHKATGDTRFSTLNRVDSPSIACRLPPSAGSLLLRCPEPPRRGRCTPDTTRMQRPDPSRADGLDDEQQPKRVPHKRVTTGCKTCRYVPCLVDCFSGVAVADLTALLRTRKLRCDEQKPACRRCSSTGITYRSRV